MGFALEDWNEDEPMTESERSQIADAVIKLEVEVRHLRTSVAEVRETLCNVAHRDEVKPACLTYMENHFVTNKEFRPVRNLVYSGVALVLAGVVGAVLALVVEHSV